MLNKQQFPTKLFVAASLATIILFGIFYFVIKIGILNQPKQTIESNNTSKYYLNENYSEGDSLITKVPNLKDMLAGPIISNLDPSWGKVNAPVTIVEFSDFECKFCQEQEKVLKQILDEYKSKVRLIWKDYPESNENSISFQAAIAARCAAEQNQFWSFHDLLYRDNNLTLLKFLEFADQLNLNRAEFVKCLDNDNIRQLVKDNIEEANALDINGVPFIYINDQEIIGQLTLEELKSIIEIELDKIQ